MTDFDAGMARRGIKEFATAALIVVMGTVLAGCETASSIFGGGIGGLASTEAPPPAPAPAPQPIARVVLAPIIGAPEPVAKQMASQLGQSIEKQRIVLAADRDPKADYTLRGYIVASRDKSGTKVSYIWDVTDPAGKRVNRITGEEVAPAAAGSKDPWASVTPAITQSIADKTAGSLGSWIPTQAAVATSTPAATPVAVQGAGVRSVVPAGPTTPAQGAPAAPQADTTTTASIPRSETAAAVAAVAGAPGDGNTSLASALQRELSRQGVALADRPASAYRVDGKVTMGEAKDGKQQIQIDWRVKDPQGKALGTVSQKNEIPQGSLDSAWGKTADAAAAAAAQGILKLLPQAKSTN